MAEYPTAEEALSAAGLPAVIDLFTRACTAFGQALERTDNVLDATDFTGTLHLLGFTAGRVRALGEALTLLTGRSEWLRQADEVLAEYMQASTIPENQEQ
jgi:hypothetical protein